MYVDRELPAYLVPGHTLSEADCHALRALLADQSGHNRRLYREIERLQAELDGTMLSRVAGPVRRRLARHRLRQGEAQ